jgi:3'-phosphoadenosine 5'-phosphosulfate sulfotransferase (PAPS reductase)/FAD synthetase
MSREAVALELIDSVTREHGASGVYVLFSGGDDSLAAALIGAKAAKFRACVHIDTGIGIPETQAFVRETCQQQGWPLLVYRAVDQGQGYDALALRYGFPGPAAHFRMYIRLKERALDAFIREHKTHRRDRLVLVTGARAKESQRRMGHVQPVRRDGVQVWVNPLHEWPKCACLDWIEQNGVSRNQVVELLHMSGECLCGSFAKPGELKEIALWYPHVAARITDLETRVRAAGHRHGWGERPKRRRRRRGRDSAGRLLVSELCQQCEFVFGEAIE